MFSASSNLAGAANHGAVAQHGRGASGPFNIKLSLKIQTPADASNRPGEETCSRDGSSMLPGGSKFMPPWSNGKTLRQSNSSLSLNVLTRKLMPTRNVKVPV